MIRLKKNRSGITLVEMLIVAGILSIVVSVFGLLFTKNLTFFRRMQVRREVMVDSRVSLDLIMQRLRNGKARTLVYETPANTPPNSKVTFDLATGVQCVIYLDVDNTLKIQEGARAPQVIASHVTGLTIANPDTSDPSIVTVGLRIEAPYDESEDPTHVTVLNMPNQTVRMLETP